MTQTHDHSYELEQIIFGTDIESDSCTYWVPLQHMDTFAGIILKSENLFLLSLYKVGMEADRGVE